MAVITVPATGLNYGDVTFNDSFQPDPSVDITSIPLFVELNGNTTLQSLDLGYDIEVDVNSNFSGTGRVTGVSDPTPGNLPQLDNFGPGTFDVNGAIDVNFNDDGTTIVSSGEKLDIEGDLVALGTETVNAGGELDLNSLHTAVEDQLILNGTLVATAPSTAILSSSVLNGAITVRGDATNGFGEGVQVSRVTNGAVVVGANGAYQAVLDLTQAPLTTPLPSLTLGPDAKVQFGINNYTVQKLVMNGSSTSLDPLDVLSVNPSGSVQIAGNGRGNGTGQAQVIAAEFSGGSFDFTVSAADGGSVLTQTVQVDAGTVVRNDGAMTLGATAGVNSTFDVTDAAAGSLFVNGASGALTLGSGFKLIASTFENDGTVDLTQGTWKFASNLTGSGSFTVESGAKLQLGATANSVTLKSGSGLSLSAPSGFTGTLRWQSTNPNLDLAGVSASGATVGSNGLINVTTTSGALSLKETGLAAGTTFATQSDGAGGTILTVSSPSGSGGSGSGSSPGQGSPAPVYRFVDKTFGTHLFTQSLAEAQQISLTRPDLSQETNTFGAVAQSNPSAEAIYRFQESNGTHFFTASAAEAQAIQTPGSGDYQQGWTFEAASTFYEDSVQQAGDVAVYRFRDASNGTQFLTGSQAEANAIQTPGSGDFQQSFRLEGIAFYAPAGSFHT